MDRVDLRSAAIGAGLLAAAMVIFAAASWSIDQYRRTERVDTLLNKLNAPVANAVTKDAKGNDRSTTAADLLVELAATLNEPVAGIVFKDVKGTERNATVLELAVALVNERAELARRQQQAQQQPQQQTPEPDAAKK